MDLEEEREKVGRESGQGRLAGAPCGWWAGVCTGEAGGRDGGRAASSQHVYTVVLGRVAPPRLGFAGRRAGRDRLSSAKGCPHFSQGTYICLVIQAAQ